MSVMASEWFGGPRIPQDLITGVIVTLIGLVILFAIKPRLQIDPRIWANEEERKKKAGYGFHVSNKGRVLVIEIKARLFKVDESTKPPTREEIALKMPELFQLRGKWAPKGNRPTSHLPPNEFRFLVKDGQDEPQLAQFEFLLFQVNGKHGFTNFSRVAVQRWYRNAYGDLMTWDAKGNPWTDITRVAGTGAQGNSGDDGPATDAELNSPEGVAPTADGGFLIADSGNNVVRKVSAAGVITRVAGTGAAGNSGDNGPATDAELKRPKGWRRPPTGGS